jgi:mannose/cellobiose epimerase-like protein (N-acyl-D-glucosamine 2-epimerase family)
LPLWLEHGVDRQRGGFHEALDLHTAAPVGAFKRLRVTTRQIYVFAEAAQAGMPGASEAVAHGLDFLFARLRHPAGGFASRCDPDGRIIDQTRDLYDLAFTLFAFAHAYRLTGDMMLRSETRTLLGYIETLRHPAGGFSEGLPASLPRRQNPHMHLLEAALACAEHMPDPAFDALCDELTALAHARFIDAGRLHEYYSDDLRPERTTGRAIVEPGHHFAWAWLLAEVARLRGGSADAVALADFALRHGRDPATGFLRGELFDDGAIAARDVRLWPHGEWLKAALVLRGGEAGDPVAAWTVLDRFLQTPIPGLWFERWDGGRFTDALAPASTLYHIVSAVTALRAAA